MRDKLERSLKAMKSAEAEVGTHVPILVHSDLVVVDDDLETISESFRRYHHLDPIMGHRLNRILLQNVVVGCTAMLNPALAALARPIPKGILMHDWWAALIASAFGRIVYLEEPTVLYRRHSRTQTSVIDYKTGWRRPLMATIEDLLSGKRVRERLSKVIAQAARFLDRFEKKPLARPRRDGSRLRRPFDSRTFLRGAGPFFETGSSCTASAGICPCSAFM